MKPLLLFFLAILSSLAPALSQSYAVKGVVVDSASKAPLDLITISLKKDDQPLKSALTKANGSFDFGKLAAGKYSVTAVAVGYAPKTVNVELQGRQLVFDLGKLSIATQSKELNEVVVQASKPLLKQEVDKITYDITADPESKSQNVLEMLRKVPLVTVDAEDNIKVKGSGSYKILINGRPSSLVARNPKDVFKSMPANSIKKIEVITTPPAKYDSEGLAGIINIITNTKVDEGYNGTVSLRHNSRWGPGGNLSGTVKKGKLGLSLFSGLGHQTQNSNAASTNRNTFSPVESFYSQNGTSSFGGDYLYSNAELSFEIDTLNLITGSIDYSDGNFRQNNVMSSVTLNSLRDISEAYNLSNNGKNGWGGLDFGFNYQLGFKNQKERLLTASYKRSKSSNDRQSEVFTTERVNYFLNDYRQANESGTTENTLQLDYVHPLKKLTIEAGVKGILRDNFSDFEKFNRNEQTNQYLPDLNQTNNFDYSQNVYSVYNSWGLKLDKWSFKAGMRAERTTVDASFAAGASQVNRSYNNFIPSISMQRQFKKSLSLNLGFTNRIERPSIWQLNPFYDQSNPKFIYTGNPNLRPVLNHSFELNLSKFSKGSVNMGLSYAFANNTIENLTSLRADTVVFTTYENAGKNKRLGFNLNMNYPITKSWDVNINGQAEQVWLKGSYNGKFYTNSGVQGNAYAYTGYKFKKGLKAGVNGGYFTQNIMLQGKSSQFFFFSGSISKDFLDNKANLSASINNPFSKFRSYRNDTNTPDFAQYSISQYVARTGNINFSYRFGKLKSGIKKNERGINNDDVKSGGKSSGGGQ